MGMITVKTADSNDLQRLYREAATAFEGLDLSDLEDEKVAEHFIKKLSANGMALKMGTTIYIAGGKLINETYDLAGDNAYVEDYHMSLIPYDDCIFDDPDSKEFMAELRANLGIRWWGDIVDNNEYREYKAGRHPHSKQIEWLVEYFNKKENEG